MRPAQAKYLDAVTEARDERDRAMTVLVERHAQERAAVEQKFTEAVIAASEVRDREEQREDEQEALREDQARREREEGVGPLIERHERDNQRDRQRAREGTP